MRRLYSIARVLSAAEVGDSLTDIQHATRLSFQTVMKTVNHLEELGFLSTRIINKQKGKMREIIYISDDHKEISVFFERILQKFDSAVNSGDEEKCSSLLFEVHLLEKSKKKVKDCLEYQLFHEAGKLFWQWADEGKITNSVKDSLSEDKKAVISKVTEATEKGYSFPIDIFSLHVDLEAHVPKVSKKIEAEATG